MGFRKLSRIDRLSNHVISLIIEPRFSQGCPCICPVQNGIVRISLMWMEYVVKPLDLPYVSMPDRRSKHPARRPLCTTSQLLASKWNGEALSWKALF
jgi:hypothetical protein